MQDQLEQKSNIVDVCALLDMKSSKTISGPVTKFLDIDDVNAALQEIH